MSPKQRERETLHMARAVICERRESRRRGKEERDRERERGVENSENSRSMDKNLAVVKRTNKVSGRRQEA